jgi:hypothetical protein
MRALDKNQKDLKVWGLRKDRAGKTRSQIGCATKAKADRQECLSYWEVSSAVAEAKSLVWASMSEAVVAGEIKAMLWKGVRRTPRFRA